MYASVCSVCLCYVDISVNTQPLKIVFKFVTFNVFNADYSIKILFSA